MSTPSYYRPESSGPVVAVPPPADPMAARDERRHRYDQLPPSAHDEPPQVSRVWERVEVGDLRTGDRVRQILEGPWVRWEGTGGGGWIPAADVQITYERRVG